MNLSPIILLVIFTLCILAPITTYAATVSISPDKSSYTSGNSVVLSGQINNPQPARFVVIQIINPQNSDFVAVDTFLPNPDGSFSKSYKADGPKWMLDGTYTVKVFYLEEEYQTSFRFTLDADAHYVPKNPQKPQTKTPSPTKSPSDVNDLNINPKTLISGFPALDKSPQYYLDRYNTEIEFKNWFDSQFPENNIDNVVNYPQTQNQYFPESDKSPQYYIDRYNTEIEFKNWFESQFPNESIYTVLGFSDPIEILPSWIRNNAGWWSTEKISDDEFVSSIQFMIANNIILVPDLPGSGNPSTDQVPDWVRNNAGWWSVGQITDDEFITAIKFLVEEGIIRI